MNDSTREFWKQFAAMREVARSFEAMATEQRRAIRALAEAEVGNRKELDALHLRLAELTKERDHWKARHGRLEKKVAVLLEKDDA